MDSTSRLASQASGTMPSASRTPLTTLVSTCGVPSAKGIPSSDGKDGNISFFYRVSCLIEHPKSIRSASNEPLRTAFARRLNGGDAARKHGRLDGGGLCFGCPARLKGAAGALGAGHAACTGLGGWREPVVPGHHDGAGSVAAGVLAGLLRAAARCLAPRGGAAAGGGRRAGPGPRHVHGEGSEVRLRGHGPAGHPPHGAWRAAAAQEEEEA